MSGTTGFTEDQIAHYTACRVNEPIEVDGRLDEACWGKAPRSPRFVDLVTGEPGFLDTRSAVLWSDEYLYVGFWVQEPNVKARFTERDCMICEENDVEVFIGGEDAYYEFEMNALGTVMEILYVWQDAYTPESAYARAEELRLTRPSVDVLGGMCDEERMGSNPRGKRWAFRDWDLPGLKVGTHIDGTLNDPSVIDKGWTAEIAFPWTGMKWLAGDRALPPRGGDTWRLDFSRFQHISVNGRDIEPPIGWAWNAHGAYNSHMPECFTYVHLSDEPISSVGGKETEV